MSGSSGDLNLFLCIHDISSGFFSLTKGILGTIPALRVFTDTLAL